MQTSPDLHPHLPSAPPTKHHLKSPPSLFDLPRELRQEIYNHVFDGIHITYSMDVQPPRILGRHQDPAQDKRIDKLKNALLRTSKQCYAEAKSSYLSHRLVKLLAVHIKPDSTLIHPPTIRLCHGIQRLLLSNKVLHLFMEWPKLPDVREATIYLNDTLFYYDNWKTEEDVRLWRGDMVAMVVRRIRRHHRKIDLIFSAADRFVEAVPREASVVLMQGYSLHGWMPGHTERGQETWRGEYRFDYRTRDFVELPSPTCLTSESARYRLPEEGTFKTDDDGNFMTVDNIQQDYTKGG